MLLNALTTIGAKALQRRISPWGQISLLRGWAIIERANEASEKQKIAAAIIDAGGTIESLEFEEVKGFSASKSFMCFEAWVVLAVESLSS